MLSFIKNKRWDGINGEKNETSKEVSYDVRDKSHFVYYVIFTFLVVMITGFLLIKHMGGIPAVLQAPAGIRLHIIAGLLMGIIVVFHFILNFRFYIAEWKCLLGDAYIEDLPAGHIIVKMMHH